MKDNDVAVLIEDLDNKFDAVAELVTSVAKDVRGLHQKVDNLDIRLERVEHNTKAITAVIKAQTSQLNTHHTRISALEAA